MTSDLAMNRRWILTGIVCGFLAMAVYFFMVFVNMSLKVGYPIAWAFGPLLAVACMGIYHFLKQHRDTIRAQIAVVFAALAACCVTLMLTVQGVARTLFPGYKPEAADQAGQLAWDLAYKSIMRAQGGMDLAWDIFIFSATALFASVMIARSIGWKILGIAGVFIGVVGLGLNLAVWPANPGTVGLVDAGPFTGAWYGVLTVMMTIEYRKTFARKAA